MVLQHELQSALPKIITTGFKHIQLIYFFTAGEDEVKCWQIRKGTKAPQVGAAARQGRSVLWAPLSLAAPAGGGRHPLRL